MKIRKKILLLGLCLGLLHTGALAADTEQTEVKAPAQTEELQKEDKDLKDAVKTELVEIKEKDEEEGKYDLVISIKNTSKEKIKGVLCLDKLKDQEISKIFEGDDKKEYELEAGQEEKLVFEIKLKEDLEKGSYPIFLTINVNNIELKDKLNLDIKDLLAGIGGSDKPGLKPGDINPDDINPGDLGSLAGGVNPGDLGDIPAPSPGMDFPMPSPGGDISIPSGSVDMSGAGASGEQQKNKPKLIISQYSFEPAHPLAGEEFKMDLSFFNTNNDKSVRNIKISLTSSDGQLAQANPIPGLTGQDQDVGGGGSSIFTPVGTSNTFYIDRIDPKSTISKSVTLTTPASLPTKNYSLVASFEYEDKDGNQFASQETIGIPIVQESKLSTSDIIVKDQAFVGVPIDGEIQFYNTGKDTLNNLMAKVTGDFDDISLEEYVGNFESGNSSSYMFTVIPKKAGAQKGKVIFTYEDQVGKTQTVEKEFSMDVSDEMPMDPEMEEQEQTESKFNMPGPFFFVGLAILIVVIIIAVMQRRKRKNQEKDLTLDED